MPGARAVVRRPAAVDDHGLAEREPVDLPLVTAWVPDPGGGHKAPPASGIVRCGPAGTIVHAQRVLGSPSLSDEKRALVGGQAQEVRLPHPQVAGVSAEHDPATPGT